MTEESFAAWRAAFEREMESCTEPFVGITLDPARRKGAKRTGREQFLMASASELDDELEFDDDDDVADAAAPAADSDAVAAPIDKAIFQHVAENLDELSFSDEDE